MLNIYKIIHDSKIYGPLNRDVIRFKGCNLHCKNCINKNLWSKDPLNLLESEELLNKLRNKDITLLGGEPLQQEEILDFIKLAKRKDIGIILFTGYEYDELNDIQKEAANLCDVVIYGRFIEELKDDSLYLRGSTNQQIIFNTSRYDQKQFDKPNSFEVYVNESESHGRSNNFINYLFDIK